MSTILIIGGTGLLGVNWALKRQHVDVVHITGYQQKPLIPGVYSHIFDAKQEAVIHEKVGEIRPDLIINCAGLANVDSCEAQPELSFQLNVVLAEEIAKVSKLYQIPFIHISTDHLFEGTKSFVSERDTTNPKNTYAKHKSEAEKLVLKINPNALVIRTTFFGWGPSYRQSFSDIILGKLKVGADIYMFDDVYFTPLYIGDLIKIAHELIEHSVIGVLNVCAGERISKYEFSVKLAEALGFDSNVIQPIQARRKRVSIERPLDMSLSDGLLKSLLFKESITIDEGINALKEDTTIKTIRRYIHKS